MYKIIKAQSKDGTDKLKEIESKHSLYGDFYILSKCAFFEYKDDSGQMMRTSTVEEVTTLGNCTIVTTRNSEYWFEKVEE